MGNLISQETTGKYDVSLAYTYDLSGRMVSESRTENGAVTKPGFLSPAKITTKAYTPFGEQIGEETSGFGWNGEYYNAATGMVYFRARFYEPEMNRFSQKDILRGSVINSASQNRYLYCQNDPVNFIDPSGMKLKDTLSKIGNGIKNAWNTVKTGVQEAVGVAKTMYYELTGKPDPRQSANQPVDAYTGAAPSASNATSSLVNSAVQAAAGAVVGAVSGIANSIIGGQGTKSAPNPSNPEVDLLTRFYACDNSKDAETVYIMFSNDANTNSDFTDAMYYQLQKAMHDGKNVVITAVNSEKEFSAAWNMLPENEVIPEVYMIFHSNGRSLIFDGSYTNGYSVDGNNSITQPVLGNITELPDRDIETLYLLGCNTGNIALLSDSDGRENLAIVFSRMIDGTVIGVDGELGFGAPSTLVDDQYNVFFPRMSQEQALFSNPQGYVEYNNGDYEVIGGLDTPMEAFWEWVLMHGNSDIDEWRNN